MKGRAHEESDVVMPKKAQKIRTSMIILEKKIDYCKTQTSDGSNVAMPDW
jgi:hypothetical protein